MKSIISFFILLIIFALLAWLGGYDFDYRSEKVASYSAFSLIIAGIVAGFVRISEIK